MADKRYETRRGWLTPVSAASTAISGIAAVANAVTAGDRKGGASKSAPSDFPRVSTRGHYRTNWYSRGRLDGNYDPYEFDLSGDFSEVFGADEVVVFVHGWFSDKQGGLDIGHVCDENLQSLGYEHPTVAFSWDADTGVVGWDYATDIAEQNGLKLANFLTQLNTSYPETDVRLIGYSLGARTALTALAALNGTDVSVEYVGLLGGAADSTSVSMSGRYGEAIEGVAGQFDNFWKGDDLVLKGLYPTFEWDMPCGLRGCDGPTPDNYTDINVDYVADHYSYYHETDGCLEELFSRF